MATPIFDKDTWLDLTVNIVPLTIIGFFVALFAVVSPWGISGLESVIGFALLVVPFVLLAYLTYISARAIESGEE
ncbi:DUF6684 family protein [Halorussus halobius]|uniref:DUF6684 family protein n=1 Tax=Halorussus halobius TaxID=1710537 RepID=UPI00109262AE|nr:DUF6684 family protein [Halorussus halobius]